MHYSYLYHNLQEIEGCVSLGKSFQDFPRLRKGEALPLPISQNFLFWLFCDFDFVHEIVKFRALHPPKVISDSKIGFPGTQRIE